MANKVFISLHLSPKTLVRYIGTAKKDHNRQLDSLIILQNKIIIIPENYRWRAQSFQCEPYFTKHIILKAYQVYHFKVAQVIYKNNLHVTTDTDMWLTKR